LKIVGANARCISATLPLNNTVTLSRHLLIKFSSQLITSLGSACPMFIAVTMSNTIQELTPTQSGQIFILADTPITHL
ncbi:hypothetical protein DFJ58DRAFT_659977, partial [Suillus subalutaceus]|uniref:uncharacterized protein n=1 Tax=Suillus subalutaceus TaxID=48586 RepID=UPI001B874606